jgi:hypothetical protein
MLQLRFSAISGNAIVREPHSTIVSDVFRIFHDLIDTGGGTGLRNMAFRYSSDDSTPLPDLSTYSLKCSVPDRRSFRYYALPRKRNRLHSERLRTFYFRLARPRSGRDRGIHWEDGRSLGLLTGNLG